MTTATKHWPQAAVIALLMVAITVLRLFVAEPGPLYLIPLILTGLWFGPWAGLGVGALGGALPTLTGALDGDPGTDVWTGSIPVRVLVYAAAGWLVGRLSETRVRLALELHERELELSELRTIQEALAPPELPARPDLEVAASYVPAEHGVSGDFYVVKAAADGATMIAVGDVAGRGLAAAKQAWYVRTLISSSADVTDDPATVLERANRALIDESPYGAPFVTAACVFCNPDGHIRWALAGHERPIRLDDGEPLGEVPGGLPLGAFERLGSSSWTARLRSGGGLLLYTDGLSEARRPAQGDGAIELFGEDRISRLVERLDGTSSQGVVDGLLREVRSFTGGELADDLCMLAVRVAGGQAPVGADSRK